MLRAALTTAGVALFALLAAAPLHADGDAWIHIQVLEAGPHGSRVEVNLPLDLVSVALGLVPDGVLSEGRLRIRNSDVSVGEMRQLWQRLRDAGDAEFVTVEREEETVRVSRAGERVLVHVTERKDGRSSAAPKVRIEVPVRLVDALFAGDGDRLDVKGALAQLRSTRGDVVTVHDGESRVRIWVDESKDGGL